MLIRPERTLSNEERLPRTTPAPMDTRKMAENLKKPLLGGSLANRQKTSTRSEGIWPGDDTFVEREAAEISRDPQGVLQQAIVRDLVVQAENTLRRLSTEDRDFGSRVTSVDNANRRDVGASQYTENVDSVSLYNVLEDEEA